MLTVVDYGRGNLFSLSQALHSLNAEHVVTSDPEAVRQADRVILPGVGAFGDAMQALRERNLVEPVCEASERGVPLLGICLGMQLLADRSEEFGNHEGLGIIGGTVKRLRKTEDRAAMRVPNVGWRSIKAHADDSFVGGVGSDDMFYFVHSYTPVVDQSDHVIATSDFNGTEIVAVIRRDQVVGTQFHPEKSAGPGLALLRRFLQGF